MKVHKCEKFGIDMKYLHLNLIIKTAYNDTEVSMKIIL